MNYMLEIIYLLMVERNINANGTNAVRLEYHRQDP